MLNEIPLRIKDCISQYGGSIVRRRSILFH